MLEVKNVKVNKRESQETVSFTCDVYENNKFIAHATNNGRGGANRYEPANGLRYIDIQFLDEFKNDCKIQELVEEADFIKSKQNKAIVIKKDDELFLVKLNGSVAQLKKNVVSLSSLIKTVKKYESDGYTILNTNLNEK